MKEYDRVELISDKQRYIDEGLKKGDKGTILGPKRSGMWLVYFDGEIFQDVDGVWKTTEIDSGVYEEDLKVIEESDYDGTDIVAVSRNGETTREFHYKEGNPEREKENVLDFVLPSEKNREDVLGFYDEIENNGEKCIGIGGYKDYDKWLEGMKNRQTGKNLPEGYVREDFLLCYEGDRLVGVFSLKFELTEYLLNYGGHIGYAVRPSDRNRGLATQMLRQGLCFARVDGFEKVLLVCDEDNLASEKVIQKNGGVFENRLFDADESVFVKRYWIQIRKAPL